LKFEVQRSVYVTGKVKCVLTTKYNCPHDGEQSSQASTDLFVRVGYSSCGLFCPFSGKYLASAAVSTYSFWKAFSKPVWLPGLVGGSSLLHLPQLLSVPSAFSGNYLEPEFIYFILKALWQQIYELIGSISLKILSA